MCFNVGSNKPKPITRLRPLLLDPSQELLGRDALRHHAASFHHTLAL